MTNENLPIKNFFIVSEDGDVEDINSVDFEAAKNMLNKFRDEQPDKVWTLMADMDA